MMTRGPRCLGGRCKMQVSYRGLWCLLSGGLVVISPEEYIGDDTIAMDYLNTFT